MKKNTIFQLKPLREILFSSLTFIILTTLVVIFLLSKFANQQQISPPIKVEREFRAAWVATVANINWPSEPGLPVDIQKQEAISLLDSLQENNFNVVIFQVRPQADALYQSDLEPWSYYLTGAQGVAPVPFYDPLAFWIEKAHERGLELHAWLNPYRAHHIKGGEVTEHSVVKTHPELVVELEMGYHWMIPTMEETKQHSLDVVMDIVKRYDVDGIHFDDYFYPYPSYNEGNDFPDDEDYAAYQKDGGDLSRGDWRREHVNTFILDVYQHIKDAKNHVKFGLSPFGIWRPGYPESIAGMDQYEKIYADAKLWLNKGWIDYFAPQLYWPINQYPQSYPVLLNWWEQENTLNRHLYPGINTRLAVDDIAIDESINQIMISRGMLSERPGNIFWNVGAVEDNRRFHKVLIEGPYKKPALVPTSPWLDDEPPSTPEVIVKNNTDGIEISWQQKSDEISQWVLYMKYGEKWQYQLLNANTDSVELPIIFLETEDDKNGEEQQVEKPITEIALTAVDRSGNESSWISHTINCCGQ